MDKLLIIGGSGFVGGNLVPIASRVFDVWATYHLFHPQEQGPWNFVQLDIGNKAEVRATVAAINPKVIIQAGALSGIACCERHKASAYEINVVGTRNMAEVVRDLNTKLIYLSTDLVFDGTRGHYTEDDEPSPVCYYGDTKRQAEEIVARLLDNYSVVRSSLLFGWSRWSQAPSRQFFERILQELESGRPFRAFGDEFRSPLSVSTFCECLMEFAFREDLTGLYHVCGSERVSAFDFAIKLAQTAGCRLDLVTLDTSSHLGTSEVKRPKDCSMSNRKALSALRTPIPALRTALSEMLLNRPIF
ncbi:MAG: SDR family oxidoreductase [Thermodesulfobacteriota bacterium]